MRYTFCFAIVLLTSVCNSSADKTVTMDTASSAVADSAKQITLEGSWQLQPVLPSDTATGKIPTITFDLTTKKFQGNTGCNNMSGSFYTSGDSLSFNEQITMTKMACPGYNEQGFVKSLASTNRYKIEKGILQLMQDKTVLSKWIRKDSSVQKKI